MVAIVILEALFIIVLCVLVVLLINKYGYLDERCDMLELHLKIAKQEVKREAVDEAIHEAVNRACSIVHAKEVDLRTQENRIHEDMATLTRVIFEATSQLRAFTHPTDFDFAGRPLVDYPEPKE